MGWWQGPQKQRRPPSYRLGPRREGGASAILAALTQRPKDELAGKIAGKAGEDDTGQRMEGGHPGRAVLLYQGVLDDHQDEEREAVDDVTFRQQGNEKEQQGEHDHCIAKRAVSIEAARAEDADAGEEELEHGAGHEE